MLHGLAFLPLSDITPGMTYLRTVVPDVVGLEDLLSYFDITYVSGCLRSTFAAGQNLVLRIHRSPPLYPPATWNVHDTVFAGEENKNYMCEGFRNHSLANQMIAPYQRPTLWTIIESFRMHQYFVSCKLYGRQHPMDQSDDELDLHQATFQFICQARRAGWTNVEETLHDLIEPVIAIGQHVKWSTLT